MTILMIKENIMTQLSDLRSEVQIDGSDLQIEWSDLQIQRVRLQNGVMLISFRRLSLQVSLLRPSEEVPEWGQMGLFGGSPNPRSGLS